MTKHPPKQEKTLRYDWKRDNDAGEVMIISGQIIKFHQPGFS